MTPSLVVVRTIGGPLNEVFAAWTDVSLLRRWLAPAPWVVVEASADARPGGSYRVVVVHPSGMRVVTFGEYVEVVPGRRIVKTWIREGDTPGVDDYPTMLTVEFRALDARSTELTLRQDQLLTPADREGNREGWRLCLDKLAALVAT